jgi:arylsulfatase A-like enzyme
MNQFVKLAGVSGACSLLALLPAHGQSLPNIIWLMAEDIAPDLECYGMKAVKTPNLNSLAQDGIKYTHCFCTNPISSPSRSAMLTGVHQSKINAQHHRSNRNVPLASPYRPFTALLREAGYTCILGNELVMGKGRKTDVNFKHTPLGEWDGISKFGLFDKFDEFTKEDQPFFAQIQLNVTHRGDWWDEIRAKSAHPVSPDSVELPPYMADDPTIRMDWAKYLDQIEYMDGEVGRIIQDLKDKGMYENTVIIFIGDNGRCNFRGKGFLFDSGVHVPLIVKEASNNKKTEGGEDGSIISSIDITASILDLAGLQTPTYMDGKPFIGKGKDAQRLHAYSARDMWDEVMDKSRAITTAKWKYIRNDMDYLPFDAHHAYMEFYRPAIHVMRKMFMEGKLTEAQALYFEYYKPKEQLYDLESDPHETINLAADGQYAHVLNEMRLRLQNEEDRNTPPQAIFYPTDPTSSRLLDFVKYNYPEAYLRMLGGEEIGYGKYMRLYEQHLKGMIKP